MRKSEVKIESPVAPHSCCGHLKNFPVVEKCNHQWVEIVPGTPCICLLCGALKLEMVAG